MRSLAKQNWLTTAGLLLALPTGYVIFISILKYGFGVNGPFDSIAPTLEGWGIKEPVGWNINLLILFGPLVGFVLAFFQVLRFRFDFSREEFQLHFTIQRRWFPILVSAFCVSVLAVLFVYMLGENCAPCG